MKNSNFQFTTPALTRLEFHENHDFAPKGELNMKIQANVNVDNRGQEKNTVHVVLKLCVGSKENDTPFYIEADEEANFRWEDGAYTEEQIKGLIQNNAVALLLSYLRPIISSVTAASSYPAYNLPFIDLTAKEK